MNQPDGLRFCIFRALLLALLMSMALLSRADKTTNLYNRLNGMPTPKLYEQGREYRKSASEIDSALMCFTILGNRSDKMSVPEEQRLAVEAYAEIAYIYYFHYYDYPKAMENMARAEELMHRWNITLPIVDLYYGLMYGSIGNQSQDEKTVRKSNDYLRSAFYKSRDAADTHRLNMAYSNLVTQSFGLGSIDSVATESHAFMKYNEANRLSDPYSIFNIGLYDGLIALKQKRYADAQAAFDNVLSLLPEENIFSRYKCGTWELKGVVWQSAGNYAKAEECFGRAMDYAVRYDLRDARLEIYNDFANLYKLTGRTRDRYEMQTHALELKDSLLNFQQIAAIDEIRFLGEMKKVELELKKADDRRRHMAQTLTVVGILLLAALGFIWVIVWNMRKLRRSNEALYAKNEEVIRAEEEERRLRHLYEAENAELRNRFAVNTKESETEQLATAVESAQPQSQEKYKTSNLTEEAKQQLAARIRDVLESSLEIYSVEFSAEQLADLVGDKYRNVSQVINETYGLNFNTLLNNYRIREACKRITDDEHFGHLTMEALSNSVGFKSRSTFVIQFKRVTGLTPSQYLSAARNARKA